MYVCVQDTTLQRQRSQHMANRKSTAREHKELVKVHHKHILIIILTLSVYTECGVFNYM